MYILERTPMESSEYNKHPKSINLLVLLVMLNKQYLANKGKDQFGRKVNFILSFSLSLKETTNWKSLREELYSTYCKTNNNLQWYYNRLLNKTKNPLTVDHT